MSDAANLGRIVKVAGPVVDAEFPPGGLPEILNAVEIDFSLGGVEHTVIGEVRRSGIMDHRSRFPSVIRPSATSSTCGATVSTLQT